MIELYCGQAAEVSRRELPSNINAATLIVAPDEVAAWSLRNAAAPHDPRGLILDFDALLTKMVKSAPTWPPVVASNQLCRAIIRNIIEATPADFDYLVGRNSVPRMSQGVLTRIVAAVESLQNQVATEEQQPADDSPRWRQIRLLAQRFESRMAEAGVMREKLAVWQGIIDLTPEIWTAAFPQVEQVVFADFTTFADEVYLAIAATSKQVSSCAVLLELDPEDETQSGSSLDAAYQRLYDMAGRIITDSEPAEKSTPAPRPLIISAPTASEEISAAIRVAHQLVTQSDTALETQLILALANPGTYAARVENALDANGLTWRWIDPEPLHECGEMLLLDRLRACASSRATGLAVAQLLRAPSVTTLLKETISTVEAWNLASRLDYILTLTGQVTGWSDIQKQLRHTIKTLHSQRQRSRQWSDEEKELDNRLLEVVSDLATAIRPFIGDQPVITRSSQVRVLLENYAVEIPATGNDPLRELRRTRLFQTLDEIAAAAEAISTTPVSFGYFVALFRTALHGATIQPPLRAHGDQVLLCSPETAATLSGANCIILGFNDGQFPRFARPDASFLGTDIHRDQRPTRARQWLMLHRLFRRYQHVQLWTPEREGTEDLLPSQFAEALTRTSEAEKLTSSAYLHSLKCPDMAAREVAEREFAGYLKNQELSPPDLDRFRTAGEKLYAAARGITVQAARSNHELSIYDGILTDPRLKAWLAAWVDRHIFSVSQLDGIVGCSFRFFAQRMLNLDELEEADDLLPAHVFGSFAHDVLARFYRTWVAAGRKALTSSDEALAREELLRAYHAEYDPSDDLSQFARDLMNLKLFGTLGSDRFGEKEPPLDEVPDVGVLGKFLLMEMQRGDEAAFDFLHPSSFEVGFGVEPTDEEDPLSTAECVVMDVGQGNKVQLWGRIDRIDISDTGIFAVTDYKTGHLPTGTEIAGGFRTQLPVYMLVAQELLKSRFEKPEPAGGLYYSLKRGKAAKISGVFVRAAYQKQLGVSGRGMKDEQFIATLGMVKDRIRHSMNALRRGYLTTTQHNPDTVCRYCAYQKLCYRDVDRTAAFWDSVEAKEGLHQGAE